MVYFCIRLHNSVYFTIAYCLWVYAVCTILTVRCAVCACTEGCVHYALTYTCAVLHIHGIALQQ
jgi:hypothetical protein